MKQKHIQRKKEIKIKQGYIQRKNNQNKDIYKKYKYMEKKYKIYIKKRYTNSRNIYKQ